MTATPIAAELEARLWVVADRRRRWVGRRPDRRRGEMSLTHDYAGPGRTKVAFTAETLDFLATFLWTYGDGWDWFGPYTWNTVPGRTRQDAIWLLETAIDQARWEEV